VVSEAFRVIHPKDEMKTITIYTDGACSGNPGPGGWGAVLIYGNAHKEMSGGEPATTNNRMEMMAVIAALQSLTQKCHVRLHSDSAYVINCFKQKWYEKWERNGWMTSGKKPVENQDLWQRMLEVVRRHKVEWIKVKGHSGDEWNDRCDELARSEAARFA
jgi:ribonuclease HI